MNFEALEKLIAEQPADWAEREARAFVESSEFDRMAAYRARGCPYAHLPDSSAIQAWAGAFTVAVYCGTPTQREAYADLSAELRLRGLDEPLRLVSEARAFLRTKIELRGPHDPGVLAAIERWREARDRAS